MKKLFFFSILISFLYFGCSDDGGGTSTNPFGGGPGGGGTGGGGSVTFTSGLAQDGQQQYYFEFKPSTGVVITQITANCAAAGINNESVQGDGTTVYTSTSPFYVGPITVLQAGQQWQFTITGKIGSSTGQAFTATTNFTVQ